VVAESGVVNQKVDRLVREPAGELRCLFQIRKIDFTDFNLQRPIRSL
jgi:hypothetical protein